MADDPYHHGDLRTAILDAAEEHLAERPIEMVSMRELARKAGVSPGAPYHHFKDRNGLVIALCQRGFSRLGELLTAKQEENGLDGQIEGYLQFSQANPALYQLMFSPEVTAGKNQEQLRPFTQPVADILAREITGGSEEEATREQGHMLVAIWCFTHGLCTLGRTDPLKHRLKDMPLFNFAKQSIDKLKDG
jgi:AcrR family transcriptional regulator